MLSVQISIQKQAFLFGGGGAEYLWDPKPLISMYQVSAEQYPPRKDTRGERVTVT